MKIRQRPTEGKSTRTYPIFDGPVRITSVITEDNGVPNDDGMIFVANGTDDKGVNRTFRVSLDKAESRKVFAQIKIALSKPGRNFVKDETNGSVQPSLVLEEY